MLLRGAQEQEVPDGSRGETTGRVREKSKTHIPQTMFLAAVAQPNKKQKFDGRVGICRCAKPVAAKRKSKNRPAGTIKVKDHALTWETFMALLKENVMKMSWAREIVNKIDSARAHIGNTSWPKWMRSGGRSSRRSGSRCSR